MLRLYLSLRAVRHRRLHALIHGALQRPSRPEVREGDRVDGLDFPGRKGRFAGQDRPREQGVPIRSVDCVLPPISPFRRLGNVVWVHACHFRRSIGICRERKSLLFLLSARLPKLLVAHLLNEAGR